jgi:glycogen synthase
LSCLTPRPEAVSAFAETHLVKQRNPVIGMAARFASEKRSRSPAGCAAHHPEKISEGTGPVRRDVSNVMGEQAYSDRLMPRIREYEMQGHWKFLGNLDPVQMAAFYPNLDVITVPSLNSTEAFGLVQIEAMMNGVPSVPSALPGVRRPVQMHGMGVVSEIGNAQSLAMQFLKFLITVKNIAATPKLSRKPMTLNRL